jgi:DNA-binding transcriptional ArsR family regulator
MQTTTDYADLAQNLAILGNATRLKILGYLKEHPGTSVEELMVFLQMRQGMVSRHLMVLRRAGLVAFEEEGESAFKVHRYSLRSQALQQGAAALAALA